MIRPTPDHLKYHLGPQESHLLQIIYDLMRQGWGSSSIDSLMSHAQYWAVAENLDLFDVIKGAIIRNCLKNKDMDHSHKKDDGIAFIWNAPFIEEENVQTY